ncbi:MAG: GNAT family N-acetyltransferase [Terriglobia bacterium]
MYFLAVDRSFETSISLASVLVGLSIKNAIREGFSTYDFLKGTEDYKFLWANQGKRSLEAIFYGKKLGPLLWMMRKSMKSMAKVLLR